MEKILNYGVPLTIAVALILSGCQDKSEKEIIFEDIDPEKIELFNEKAAKEFHKLAEETGGEMTILVNSEKISEKISSIIDNYGSDNSNFLLMVDKTTSMEDDISNVKKGLTQIINSLKKYNNIRVGVVLYGDRIDRDWYSFVDCGKDLEKVKEVINGILLSGKYNVDLPESGFEAFAKTADFWENDGSGRKNLGLWIGDAASKSYSPTVGEISDRFILKLNSLSEEEYEGMTEEEKNLLWEACIQELMKENKKNGYSLKDMIRFSKKNGITINHFPILVSDQ